MILLATLALTLAAPNLCTPADDPALRQRLEPMLGTIDRPITPADWRRLPPEARAALEAIASDPTELPTRRAAALDGAAAMGSDGALHERLAGDRTAPALLRLRAIRGLAQTLPAARRGQVLLPHLRDDPDGRIRAAAAEALSRTAPADGCPAVRAQALRERPDERVRFERALADCANVGK